MLEQKIRVHKRKKTKPTRTESFVRERARTRTVPNVVERLARVRDEKSLAHVIYGPIVLTRPCKGLSL